MYDRFLSRLAAVNNNLKKYMPSGIEVDGISFNELALVNRPEHAAVLGRIFTSWSLIESSITALLGLECMYFGTTFYWYQPRQQPTEECLH